MSTTVTLKTNLREKMAAAKAKIADGTQAPPPRPAPVEAPPAAVSTADLLSSMAGKTKVAKGKTDKPRVVADDAMSQMLDKYFLHAEEAKSHKAMADTCRDQIVSAARPLFYEACSKQGKSLSSINLGKGSMTVVNNYSLIDMTEAENLADCFGEEYSTYFRSELQLSVKKESANDGVVMDDLIKKLGTDFFSKHFDVKLGLKVTEALHVAINTNVMVREAAQPFIDQQIIKPYSPSLKLA